MSQVLYKTTQSVFLIIYGSHSKVDMCELYKCFSFSFFAKFLSCCLFPKPLKCNTHQQSWSNTFIVADMSRVGTGCDIQMEVVVTQTHWV